MEQFEFLIVPVVEVDLAPAAIVETTIDKTGPAGPPGSGGEAVDAHVSTMLDPHGPILTQTSILVAKAAIGVVNHGGVSISQTVNFAAAGCHTYTINGASISMDVSSLAPGQRGSVHILSGVTAPTITWVGVNTWLGLAPIFEPLKLTAITLFNDGVRIIGSFGKED